MLSDLKTKIIAGVLFFCAGLFVGHHFTARLDEAKQQQVIAKAEQKKDEIEQKGEQLAVQHVAKTRKLTANLITTKQQIVEALTTNEEPKIVNVCRIPRGFVRLYNDSAAGETSAPSDSDGDAADLDLAALLDILTTNNEKYNEVRSQLIELQNFERQASQK